MSIRLRRVIIGVDESGDFRLGSRALFVGVFIRPAERDSLVATYRAWEPQARKALGVTNELKGHALPDTLVRSFFRDVIARDGQPRVRYLAFAVDVNAATLEAMEVQRQLFLRDYGRWATELRGKDDNRAATWVEQHADWCRKRPAVQILKLVMLGTIISSLIERAIPHAILSGFDEELEHLQVLIDRGYVKHDDLPRWRELLRNAIINESHAHPIVTLDTSTPDHPFLRKFIGSGGNGPTLLKPAFREAIDFHDSVGTAEVRMADVLASVIYRATIHGDGLTGYSLIRKVSFEPDSPYRLIVWTKNRRPPIANPYLSVERPSG